MKKSAQELIKEYRLRIEKNRKFFYDQKEGFSTSKNASDKFTKNGVARSFHGWSLVYFIPYKNEPYQELTRLQKNFQESVQKAGISSKFAFLPVATYHITLVGIATNQSDPIQDEIIERTKECFEIFRKEKLSPPDIMIRGDISPDGSTIIAPVEPVDSKNLDTLYHIREIVRGKLHPLGEDIVKNTPHDFHGHITLSYMVQDFSKEEFVKLKDILKQYEDKKPLGESIVSTIALHRFETMVEWGGIPLVKLKL